MRLFSFTLLLFLGFGAVAQNAQISGIISDDAGLPLIGATARLQDLAGIEIKGAVTDEKGQFVLSGLERGSYLLEFAYLGYETRKQEIEVKSRNLKLDNIVLVESSVNLESIEVTGKAPIASQKEDTIQFNATAFKTMKDASAEDLITKMPSVQMEGGQLKAQGENVQRVLVDGKPFFGNDPSAALKNLPAEVIDKIQIFDQASEQSNFSGVQDGNTFKTINIVTKSNMRAGQFGKIYAGYGLDNRYQSGGNINIFDGERRISLIGMSNNINVQNFASEDILGVLGQSGSSRGGPSMPGRNSFRGNQSANDFLVNASGGITNTTAFGLNYSDKWGKKIEVSGSYFFNLAETRATSDLSRLFLAEEGDGQNYVETADKFSSNQNHRVNFRLEYTIDSFNSIIFKPRFTMQGNKGDELIQSATRLGDVLINAGDNNFYSQLNGMSAESDLLWRHKFSKPRRTLSVNVVSALSPKQGDYTLKSFNQFYAPEETQDTLNQFTELDVTSWNSSINLDYTEPLTEKTQVAVSYKISYQQEESDRLANDFNATDGEYTIPNNQLSNLFSNNYWTQNGGLAYIINPNRDLNITIRANYQHATLINDQTLPQVAEFSQTFTNILPFASVRWTLDKNRNFRFFYRSSTRLPSIDQLQNVVNNQNPLQLRIGNPNLKQSESQSVFMRYQFTDPAASRMFFIMGGGGINTNQVVNSTWFAGSDNPIFNDLDISPGAQLVQPVNLNGSWNLRSFIAYSLPFSLIKSNINLDASYNYQSNPGLVNGVRTNSQNHIVTTGLTVSSNISDKLDFTLSGRPSWNQVTNSNQPGVVNTYINQVSTFRFNWQIWEGFVVRWDLNHMLNTGLADGFNQNFWLWNVALGKKLFKNERGEIALSVNDVLRQNRNISRSVTETWIEDSRTNALQQVVLLTFTYNLRHFGAPPSRPKEEDGPRMMH